MIIGVISDTHGLMRPEALEALQGSDVILHAGDIGKSHIIDILATIAPCHAIRGNVDTADWCRQYPATDTVEIGHFLFYLIHDLQELDLMPAPAGIHAVISGHTHRPSIEHQQGVLFFNPGSAGPRRLRLPCTLAKIHVENDTLRPEIIKLDIA